MSDGSRDYSSQQQVSPYDDSVRPPCRTPSPVRPSSASLTPPSAPFSPSPISSPSSSLRIHWQQLHQRQHQSPSLDLTQQQQWETSHQLRLDQASLGSAPAPAAPTQDGPDTIHSTQQHINSGSSYDVDVDGALVGTSPSASTSFASSAAPSLSSAAQHGHRRKRSQTEHINIATAGGYLPLFSPHATRSRQDHASSPTSLSTSITARSRSPPLLWARTLPRSHSSRSLGNQVPREGSSTSLSSTSPFEFSIMTPRGSRFQASDERTVVGESSGGTRDTESSHKVPTGSFPSVSHTYGRGPDIPITPPTPRIGYAPLPPTPTPAYRPSSTTPPASSLNLTSLPASPFRARYQTGDLTSPFLNRFDAAHIGTSSSCAPASLKRSSMGFPLSTSPTRPRAYRKIGATNGLGLHVPPLGVSGSQVSKAEEVAVMTGREGGAALLRPVKSQGMRITSAPQVKPTLPRFDDLELPAPSASGTLYGSRSLTGASTGYWPSRKLGRPQYHGHSDTLTAVYQPAYVSTLSYEDSSVVMLPPLRSNNLIPWASVGPTGGFDDAAGDEDENDSLICSSDPGSESRPSAFCQSTTASHHAAAAGWEETSRQVHHAATFETRPSSEFSLRYGYTSSSPRLHASTATASGHRQRASTSISQVPRLPRILRSHSDGSNVNTASHKFTSAADQSVSGVELSGDEKPLLPTQTGLVRSTLTRSSTKVKPSQQQQHQHAEQSGTGGPTDLGPRYDLINHAHHLKLFLAFAPELLLADQLGDIPGLLVENSRSSSSASASVSARESPTPGAIFITRPRGSEHGHSALVGTWSTLPRSGKEGGGGSGSGTISASTRSSQRHQQQQQQQQQQSTQTDLMRSHFETFYVPQSKARQRLEKARQVTASKSASGSAPAPHAGRHTSHGTVLASRSHQHDRASSSIAHHQRARPLVLSSVPPASASASASALARLPAMPIFHRFPLPTNNFDEADQGVGGAAESEEVFVSCVLWDGQTWLTGTDICRIIRFRFESFGRKIVNLNKFHEGIYSDLRNIKAGAGATCEEPKSAFLEALYIYETIQSAKRQKTFHWFPIAMHDQLFLDQLSRDYERRVRNEAMCTEAVREPALSFVYNGYLALADQLGLGDGESGRPAPLHHPTVSQNELLKQIQVDEVALHAMAMGINDAFLPPHGHR
ncbi:unnamed protein product [Tilletia controversa]|nr:unnamed protein product [Tilletia controversa]